MPKAAGMQLLFGFGTAQARRPLGRTRGLLTMTRRGEPGLSIDELGDLSIDQA
jgi:hypothetical protein